MKNASPTDMIHPVASRNAPLEIPPEEFRSMGYALVDRITEYLIWINDRSNPVTRAETPSGIRQLIGGSGLPESGRQAATLLDETARLLFEHSLFNGHPAFWGYITSSPATIGILGDFLASAVNPNVGAFELSPVATEIERQTVRWIAEMIGYPASSGGLLVSGGNQANFVCFLAARKAKLPWDVRKKGLSPDSGRLRVYCSAETHTWINKAADLFGLGNDAVIWIPVDDQLRMDTHALRRQVAGDLNAGLKPIMVVGAAGTVGTGAIDPLAEIAAICSNYSLWFHVDGAYGGFAAALPEATPDLRALGVADSIAVDPHKWLYAPLEAGCALVRDRKVLRETFSYHPEYYRFDEHDDEDLTNFYELGPQNSRGFRALKVWLALRHAGREGYVQMIRDDCSIARYLYEALPEYPELERLTHGLSITTFRYVPADLKGSGQETEEYLNTLNAEILSRLQKGGKAYLSNAMVKGTFALRVCVVNFRTTRDDILRLPRLVQEIGGAVDGELRKEKK